MIEVTGVVKRFGAFVALDHVSLAVPAGTLTALLGPSGSGKSTLLRVMAGLERPDAGQVTLAGREATALPPGKRGIGFVFQHYAPFTHLTVWENVAFGLSVRRRPAAEIRERVAALLELVQLTGLGGRYPAQLSGGQRQRMALARALAVEPDILLLDEPFGALDARVRRELRGWLRRLHEQAHVTSVLVTHDQEEALDIADQIVVMHAGRIEQVGSPRAVYEQPQNAFVMTFVGAATRLGGWLVRPHDVEVCLQPGVDAHEAMIERLVHLGPKVKLELVLGGGEAVVAEVTVAEADDNELCRGQIVYLRARGRVPAPRSV